VAFGAEQGMKTMWRAATLVFLCLGVWTCAQGGDTATVIDAFREIEAGVHPQGAPA